MRSLYTQVKAASKFVRVPSLRSKLECLLEGLEKKNMKRACARFGIHRSTAYRWLHRLEESGWDPAELHPRSSRPHSSPGLMDTTRQERILWYRNEFQYGEDRIAWYLTQEGLAVSGHGVSNVLHRADVPFRKRRDKKPKRHTRRYNLDRPGQGLQLDIKYVPFPVEEKKAYVFNAIDDCSRWRFQYGYRQKSEENACDFIQRLAQAAPFVIEHIQTDNESCFTDRFVRGPVSRKVHPFPALLETNRIKHKLIPPGIKELNGKVERSHKTDDQEFYWRLPLWISFEECQKQLHRWTFEYNQYRPHSSLKMKTPIQRLSDFDLAPKDPCAGLWPDPVKPTHYQAVSEKLREHRRQNPENPLIHWSFKPKGPQTLSPPIWQKNTPSAIKNVSLTYGGSTLFPVVPGCGAFFFA